MICVICKNPDIQLKTVDEEIKFKKDIILVPIEVLVCTNCGERYYDKKTMMKLEHLKSQIENNEITVESVGMILRPKVA